jgi:predicted nucleic acid-binding protein
VKPRVYIETTVVSYYTGRPSRDLVTAAHQQLTRDWWEERLPILGGCISELVLTEASQGDKQAARLRMDALEKFPILEPGKDSVSLTNLMVESSLVPGEYVNDALHVAIAAVNGIEFLVTWNCKHLANATIRTRLESLIEDYGYESPVICTPEELMEEV